MMSSITLHVICQVIVKFGTALLLDLRKTVTYLLQCDIIQDEGFKPALLPRHDISVVFKFRKLDGHWFFSIIYGRFACRHC